MESSGAVTKGPFGGSRVTRSASPPIATATATGQASARATWRGSGRRANARQPSHGRGAVGYLPCRMPMRAVTIFSVSYITRFGLRSVRSCSKPRLPEHFSLSERRKAWYDETHTDGKTSHQVRQPASRDCDNSVTGRVSQVTLVDIECLINYE